MYEKAFLRGATAAAMALLVNAAVAQSDCGAVIKDPGRPGFIAIEGDCQSGHPTHCKSIELPAGGGKMGAIVVRSGRSCGKMKHSTATWSETDGHFSATADLASGTAIEESLSAPPANAGHSEVDDGTGNTEVEQYTKI